MAAPRRLIFLLRWFGYLMSFCTTSKSYFLFSYLFTVSFSDFLSSCLSVCPSVCLPICPTFYLPACLSVCPSVWLSSVCQSVFLSVDFSVCRPVYLSICLSVGLTPVCLLVYQSGVYRSIRQSIRHSSTALLRFTYLCASFSLYACLTIVPKTLTHQAN